ncbi:hypothetical protein QRD43_01705 [Pelomonas sp. APW6]|uniref:Uncharacterized protein n=1 Tax=Roseateles subflavus TaxID=3053353 RepID=A0ABT7LCM1_9BURK|nr:hypothetical protein [Pelomonas sp. APW6]MDL5030608.1 hypothetical protein [Pelomonas sp. APW6]
MELIATKHPAQDKVDTLELRRDDGSRVRLQMPRQGTLPHDLIHVLVEALPALRQGFLDQVARGAEPAFTMRQLHAHPAEAAEAAAGAWQVEAVVEALQTQLWAGCFDADAFADGVRLACEARGVGVPATDARHYGASLHAQALRMLQDWQSLPAGGTLALRHRPAPA